MKATLVDQPFDEPGWIYEIKWDGYRAISYLNPGRTQIYSRNNLEFTQFDAIREAMDEFNFRAILDGEIVALKEDGTADFGALQNWKNKKKARLHWINRCQLTPSYQKYLSHNTLFTNELTND